MKSIFIIIGAVFLFLGCSSKPKNNLEMPLAYEAGSPTTQSRQIAEDEIEKRFNLYFSNSNYFSKLQKIKEVAQHLHSVMPDKGSAKKRLVSQFSQDVSRVIESLAGDKTSTSEKFNAWLPMSPTGRNEKVQTLGQIVQSYKVMSRMGIYLTASGVIDPDSATENYYYTFLDRALYNIENELRNLMLIYPVEKREEQENNSKINYAKALANDSRSVIRRHFQSNNRIDLNRVDKALKQIQQIQNSQQSKRVLNSADYKYTTNAVKQLHIMNSGDITGFEDEMDMTLRTKFSVEMINHLLTGVR